MNEENQQAEEQTVSVEFEEQGGEVKSKLKIQKKQEQLFVILKIRILSLRITAKMFKSALIN